MRFDELVQTSMHRCPIKVRPSDLDSLCHVNNAVYFTYLEMARTDYWKHVFGAEREVRDDIILARAEVDYRAQATNDHDLNVAIRVSRIGTSSFEFRYTVVQEETNLLVAEGRSVQVMFDYPNNRTVPVPKAVKQRMLEFEGPGNIIVDGRDDGA